jgi:hypothetical protein
MIQQPDRITILYSYYNEVPLVFSVTAGWPSATSFPPSHLR